MNRTGKITVIAVLSILVSAASLYSQQPTRAQLKAICDSVRTPYKYGLIVAPADNNHKIDCPTVFRLGDRWLMTYLVYDGAGGSDGRGYQTMLAESDNLLEWRTLGVTLPFGDKQSWDCNQRGGYPALIDIEWNGTNRIEPYRSRYWISYLGGSGKGYEVVEKPLSIGVASRKADDMSVDRAWTVRQQPVLSFDDSDAGWWEQLTQYKSFVFEDKERLLGARFVMFYNAGGINPDNNIKGERVGIALSDNMVRWRRYEGNPVFAHESAGTITGDAQIRRIGEWYVMFYFSAFNPSRPYLAYNTFAVSRDLVNWTDWTGDDLIVPSEPYDNQFAHKSWVVHHNGVTYHYYCAVNADNQRGIAVATSQPMGRSKVAFPKPDPTGRRGRIELTEGWKTWIEGTTDTLTVSVPHNWDDYYGYRQYVHGNLHGCAIYERRFELPDRGERVFLNLEGVGTYATVVVNGTDFGRRAVGRVSTVIDITDAVDRSGSNSLRIVADHPSMITDMPFVCGGCSSEWGFSEGSQPMGLFRPVTIETTSTVRIEPFGVHVWNDAKCDTLHIVTTLHNYGTEAVDVELVSKATDRYLKQTFRLTEKRTVEAGCSIEIEQSFDASEMHRWSTDDPYLYTLGSIVKYGGSTRDDCQTRFGIRSVSFPSSRNDGDGRLLINGSPLMINGTCEYEHLLGSSHAFCKEQIASRIKQIRLAGFNALRDAHQPHNLYYNELTDREGLLCWTQFSAHVWYDTPAFRENFKALLRQWVIERRNSPSVVMWGLQNESVLPREFAEECCDIIRGLDPTATTQRPITTCNGGTGTDWNVVQNWSGTYGGDVEQYGSELNSPSQLLNGEYGAWRTMGLHDDPDSISTDHWSEERFRSIMERKIALAESVRERVCGQFQWIYNSHDNPGRTQPDEAYRTVDKVGPVNYKGLVTPWEEPTDGWYMYRAAYADPSKEPSVYIVSHTSHDRFAAPCKATIEVLSNCDSVALFNSATTLNPLGTKANGGRGTHFEWHGQIDYNTLHAVGYVAGRVATDDRVVFANLPRPADFDKLNTPSDLLRAAEGYNYLYRINCGGSEVVDEFGQQWSGDCTAVSHSWSGELEGCDSPYTASQKVTFDPIGGTTTWSLAGTLRYGRHRLGYTFALPDGKYRIEFYFVEPWWGTGSNRATSDFGGLRVFDVAVDGKTVIDDLDIWIEAGHDQLLKRCAEVEAKGGKIDISFPETKAGQAVVSAIAIATTDPAVKVAAIESDGTDWEAIEHDRRDVTPKESLPESNEQRKATVYTTDQASVSGNTVGWNIQTGLAQQYAIRIGYKNLTDRPIEALLTITDANQTVVESNRITFAPTPAKWRLLNTATSGYINAGNYEVKIESAGNGLEIKELTIQ